MLAVDDVHLYWVDQREVGKIPLGGGAVDVIAQNLITDPVVANSIAVDGSGVYWCETRSGLIRTTLAFCLSASDYFPLSAGTSWTFQQDGKADITYTVLAQPETVNDGVQTRVVQHSDGYQQYFTNDDSGIRLHREYDPAVEVEGAGVQQASITFEPALVYAASTLTSGQASPSSGTVKIEFSSLGTYDLNYSAQSTMEGLETLDLSLGG